MRHFALLLTLVPFLVQAQYVYLHFNDGVVQTYSILDVISTKYEGTDMVITLVDGTTVSYEMTGLDRVEHGDISTSMEELDVVGSSLAISAYPNPSSGIFNIELKSDHEPRMEIMDQGGRIVAYLSHQEKVTTSHWTWDGTGLDGRDLPSGTYIVRATVGSVSLSKSIILQR